MTPAASPPAEPIAGGIAIGETAPADPVQQILVTAPPPRFVAPTTRDGVGRIWAPVYIDGKGPFRLVLDTGANRSVITADVANALGWQDQGAPQARIRGLTGTKMVPVLQAGRLEMGELLLAPVTLPIVEDVFGGAQGVLGSEGLGNKRIAIDFARDSVTIRRSKAERPSASFQTLPIKLQRRHLLTVDIRVGRVNAMAILSTAAPTSVGNPALLAALKKSAANEPQTDIVGVTLDVEKGNRVDMPTIYMGTVAIRGMNLTFGDIHLFRVWKLEKEPALILGMDVLGVLREIIIDYRTRELHLRMQR